MLLGVCLLTSGDFGRRLVFRFPPAKYSTKQENNNNNNNNNTSNNSNESDNYDFFGFGETEFIRLLSPFTTRANSEDQQHVVEIAVDNIKFLSFPIRLPNESAHEIAAFTLVFVLSLQSELQTRNPISSSLQYITNNNYDAIVLSLYKAALQRLSRALEHEQYRCAFISIQSSIIQAKKENKKQNNSNDSNELMKEILQISPLARHLKDIYNQSKQLEFNFYKPNITTPTNLISSINGNDSEEIQLDLTVDTLVHVAINDWIYVDFTLSPRDSLTAPMIRPDQTILLTSAKSILLETLPADTAPLLSLVIARVNPSQSLLSIASDLSMPLPSLMEFAKHLVQWGKARIIDTLDDGNQYIPINNTLTISRAMEFSRTFPGSSLSIFLSSLNPPKTIKKHLSRMSMQAKQTFKKQIIWALENEAIQQIHTVIFAIENSEKEEEEEKKESFPNEEEEEEDDDDGDRDSNANWSDARWAKYIAREFGSGTASLTEISWHLRAHLTKTRIEEIIHNGKSQLLTVTRTERELIE